MGYRLTARIAGTDVRYPLESGEHSIGTAPENDLVLTDPTVSRRQARVRHRDGALTIEDLGSRNGTFLNGVRVREPTPLAGGDRVQFGDVVTRIQHIPDADMEAAVAGSRPQPSACEAGQAQATLDGSRLGRLVTRTLVRLVRAVRTESAAPQTAISVLVQCFPEGAFRLHRDSPDGPVLADHEDSVAADTGSLRCSGLCLVWRAPRVLHTDIEAAGRVVLEILAMRHPEQPAPAAPSNPPELPEPKTRHPGLRRIYEQASRVARGQIGVLIEGESGTGKELLASYIHQASGLPADRMVVLNCAALPENLIESELFGIEKGVATGVDVRPGKFELADGGTLFLDEIGEMSSATQSKILRVLQEGQVFRVGAKAARPAKVRIVAATNRAIGDMVQQGEFRRDLYHRIAGWAIRLPTLAERSVDIVNLAAWFLEREVTRRSLAFGGISVGAADCLRAYSWPGNIRELELEMSRAALFLDDGEMLDSSMLAEHICQGHDEVDHSLESRVRNAEARAIRETLEASGGNVSETARILEIGRSTLYRRMRDLGI